MNDKIPLDYEKAEKIYRMALAKNVEDEEEVLGRLMELESERKSMRTRRQRVG